VALSGTLIPCGYDKAKKKITIINLGLPAEFKTKLNRTKIKIQMNLRSNGSFVYWVTKGYVVLDDASFPIIGEGTSEPNDNFSISR
jgi:hypothetical protein